MNVRSPSPNANLENLKKQAKQLLRRAKKNEPKALARFRQYFDSEVEIGLKRAQLVLAREYGFASWNRLVDAVGCDAVSNTSLSGEPNVRHEFLKCFRAGDVASAAQLLESVPNVLREAEYEAHHLLRAFVDSNSGHCYKKAHLRIAGMLIPLRVRAFRDAVVDDGVEAVRAILSDDPELVVAEFTAGRGIAQAMHHFRSVNMAAVSLDAGANIDARTTVHHIGDTPLGIQLRFGTVETAQFLLSRGANPNGGLLKFMHTKSMSVLVPLLLEHGWDIDEGRGVRTLLHHDAAHRHKEKLQILLSHGADPNALDANRRTALHVIAARGKPTSAIRLVAEAGAKLDAKDCDGKTPLDYARVVTSDDTVLGLLS